MEEGVRGQGMGWVGVYGVFWGWGGLGVGG